MIALNQRRAAGDFPDEAEYLRNLRAAVADVVARQRDTGINLVNDGEYGHSMGQRYDYGSWWTYVFQRLGGVELTQAELAEIPQAKARPCSGTSRTPGGRWGIRWPPELGGTGQLRAIRQRVLRRRRGDAAGLRGRDARGSACNRCPAADAVGLRLPPRAGQALR